MSKIIWVLNDYRPGNYSQSLGLAESLKEEFLPLKTEIVTKKITYNSLAKLPNFLKISGLHSIDRESKSSLLKQKKKPDIIISAGRKSAPILAYLKKKYSAFAVQIMNPNFNFNKFDLVILPTHDKEIKATNVVRILGALTRIKEDLLQTEYQKFADIFEKIKKPKIAFLVGGSTKKKKFSANLAKNLAKKVSQIAENLKAHLFILDSRRTGAEISQIIDQNLSGNFEKTFFKWQDCKENNPYFAVLQAADLIIATGDSISMCCEICSLGKKVYIFDSPEICSEKHQKFLENLFEARFAEKLDGKLDDKTLEFNDSKKLSETNRIAKLIIKS